MGRKALKKQRAFQRYCRDQVVSGMINHADGLWRRADTSKAMDRDQLAGYRVGASKKRTKVRVEVEG